MMVYLFIGIGGMIGSILRYLLSHIIPQIWGGDFPWGTLIINLSGSFFLGWITNKLVVLKKLPPQLLTALTTGVIGSYTTFSTFCLETVQLMEAGKYYLSLLYIVLSLMGGLLFVRIGLEIAENN